MKKDPATGYYTCTLKEANKIDVEIKASGTSSKNWEVKKSGNTYTFIYKGKTSVRMERYLNLRRGFQLKKVMMAVKC